jgi:Zn-dependent M28 family amino/carboxypeptidase
VRRLLLVVALGLAACAKRAAAPPSLAVDARLVASATAAADRITLVSEREPDVGWTRLRELTHDVGHRISGSSALDRAIAWAERHMRDDELDDVRTDSVLVPHWIRGVERGRIVRPVRRRLSLLALGGSVGTKGELRAPVVAFDSLDALRSRTAPLDGAIAFVNQQMPPYDEATHDPGYRIGLPARLHSASEAAKRGASAVLVRSVTAIRSKYPHAGALAYDDDAPRIPAAAISTEDADELAVLARRGPVEVSLVLGAHRLPDAPSANVVGELRGTERPDEIVLLGAHLDSWDVGQGASDDGAGCVAVMEALRLLRASGLAPRRTIRAVLFTAEEYELAGARDYRRRHGGERHVAAFETDFGMGAPEAIGVGTEERVRSMTPLLPLFARFGVHELRPRAYGADVRPIVEAGAMGFDLEPDGRHYFDTHHTAADRLDVIRPDDLRRNAAATALLAWILADA